MDFTGPVNVVPRMLHVTVSCNRNITCNIIKHNLSVQKSGQLHKNKDHRKKYESNFWKNLMFLSDLYEI